MNRSGAGKLGRFVPRSLQRAKSNHAPFTRFLDQKILSPHCTARPVAGKPRFHEKSLPLSKRFQVTPLLCWRRPVRRSECSNPKGSPGLRRSNGFRLMNYSNPLPLERCCGLTRRGFFPPGKCIGSSSLRSVSVAAWILSGDTFQHHGVERGDALGVLENAGVVTQAMLTTIVRQQIEPLRLAVQELSQGRTESGFDKLDQFGAVQEIEDKTERLNAIADLHLAARARSESSLIVAPTHAECRANRCP
jgi:hypothetical protein